MSAKILTFICVMFSGALALCCSRGVGKSTGATGSDGGGGGGTTTTALTVTVNQAGGQADAAGTLPVNFTVVFSKAVTAATFTTADITHNGTASGITWTITDSGDHITFTLRATAVLNAGTLQPNIAAGVVQDSDSNTNTASTATDNSVNYVGHHVFVTNTTYAVTGGFTGVTGANTLCTTLANAAGFTGSYSAIMSDSTTSAYDRITINDGGNAAIYAYSAAATKVLIATGQADLWDGTIDNPINYSQTYAQIASSDVWTGSDSDGSTYATFGSNCTDWTVTTVGQSARVGNCGATTAAWASNSGFRIAKLPTYFDFKFDSGNFIFEKSSEPARLASYCATSRRLYCISQ